MLKTKFKRTKTFLATGGISNVTKLHYGARLAEKRKEERKKLKKF